MKQKMKTSTFKAEASSVSGQPPCCLSGSVSWRSTVFLHRPLSWRTCAALPVTWRSPWQLLGRMFLQAAVDIAICRVDLLVAIPVSTTSAKNAPAAAQQGYTLALW